MTMVANPWTNLPAVAPYLLPEEQDIVIRHNAREMRPHLQIRAELLPEPYLGRPDAPVLLLNLNPGFSADDEPFYALPAVRERWRSNLLHLPSTYPFYMLDPGLADTQGGTQWWAKMLGALIRAATVEKVANNLCCVEYFPYHSRRYPAKLSVPSQEYSFHLVEQAMARGAMIVLMRSGRIWKGALPTLESYPNLFALRNVQRPWISPRNLPHAFDALVEIVQNG